MQPLHDNCGHVFRTDDAAQGLELNSWETNLGHRRHLRKLIRAVAAGGRQQPQAAGRHMAHHCSRLVEDHRYLAVQKCSDHLGTALEWDAYELCAGLGVEELGDQLKDDSRAAVVCFVRISFGVCNEALDIFGGVGSVNGEMERKA